MHMHMSTFMHMSYMHMSTFMEGHVVLLVESTCHMQLVHSFPAPARAIIYICIYMAAYLGETVPPAPPCAQRTHSKRRHGFFWGGGI